MKILWISPYAPYDMVGHAGGQNHNYYLKYIKKHTDFDITLVTVCEKNEKSKLDLDDYGIDSIVGVHDIDNWRMRVRSLLGKVLCFRDGGLLDYAKYLLLKKGISAYAKRGEVPDIIIAQWTEASLMYTEIRKLFPTSKFIAIEEDVAFLGFQRKYQNASGIYRLFKKYKFLVLKKKELSTLGEYDLVVALNDKDYDLLCENGLETDCMLKICSYYNRYQNAIYQPDPNQILYYGAMGRKENNKSVLWFIENVMPLLDDDMKLIVIGSNPSEALLRKSGARVIVKGFVEDVQPYFEKCICLVAPLVLGGGIKIKVLEALSAGLPVLTNDIGAEGINLENEINYLHCEKADDYAYAISKIKNNKELREALSKNGKYHVECHFNTDKEINKLIDYINNNL